MAGYAHAIAAYALGEYYSMTKDESAAPLLRQAVDYIVKGQGPDGGWMYGYDKSQANLGFRVADPGAQGRAPHRLEYRGRGSGARQGDAQPQARADGCGGFGYRKAEDRKGEAGYSR